MFSRRILFSFLSLTMLALGASTVQAQAARKADSTTKPARIAVINFMHETVTFLPYDTEMDDFIYEGSPARGEALLSSSPKGYIGGFVKVAREHANRVALVS